MDDAVDISTDAAVKSGALLSLIPSNATPLRVSFPPFREMREELRYSVVPAFQMNLTRVNVSVEVEEMSGEADAETLFTVDRFPSVLRESPVTKRGAVS